MRALWRLTIVSLTAGWVMSAASLPRLYGQSARLREPGVTRTYYVAADEVDWNYAPSDHDHMTGRPYTEQARRYLVNGPQNIGRIYRKAIYREYTDGTFTALKPRPAQWAHLGLLGPVIRAEVGDTLKIVFKNQTRFPFSMHPHGVRYEQASDGTTAVAPGETFTYTWDVDARSGPAAGEPSSRMWLYHSHIDEARDVASGLLGTIIVSAKDTTNPDGSPKDVDREFVIALYTLNENGSFYLSQNIERFIRNPRNLNKTGSEYRDIDGQMLDVGFQQTNVRETINGYVFGNVPGLVMKKGERVRWYTAGMGPGFHTVHWHGNTVVFEDTATDIVPALPAEMHTEDMLASNAGSWMLHCHNENHVANGMITHYVVEPSARGETSTASR